MAILLSRHVYIFDPTQKDLREIEKKAETAVQRYFLLCGSESFLRKKSILKKKDSSRNNCLAQYRRYPASLMNYFNGSARTVQEWEFSGVFPSEKMGKDMQFESHAERAVLRTLEKMPEVEWYDVQCIQFDYTVKDKKFIYYPDIISRLSNGQVVIVEVKPVMTMALLKTFTKATVAKKYCDENRWHYVILSPNDGA